MKHTSILGGDVRSKHQLSSEEENFVETLSKGVWVHYVGGKLRIPVATALLDHVQRVRGKLETHYKMNRIKDPITDFTSLISIIRQSRKGTVSELYRTIEQTKFQWITDCADDESQILVLESIVYLWLFVDLEDHNRDIDLRDNIAAKLPQWIDPKRYQGTVLSPDLSFKNLMRKADFRLSPTSDLAKHLTFDGRHSKTLFIFNHASLLELLEEADEADLYPRGFLREVRNTLHLLFEPNSDKMRSKLDKFQRKRRFDVEAQMASFDELNLTTYSYFAERLAEVQRRYDSARPTRLKQWWYDRRARNEWATLVVAIIVFLLTVIFGLIQSITGILQVMKS